MDKSTLFNNAQEVPMEPMGNPFQSGLPMAAASQAGGVPPGYDDVGALDTAQNYSLPFRNPTDRGGPQGLSDGTKSLMGLASVLQRKMIAGPHGDGTPSEPVPLPGMPTPQGPGQMAPPQPMGLGGGPQAPPQPMGGQPNGPIPKY